MSAGSSVLPPPVRRSHREWHFPVFRPFSVMLALTAVLGVAHAEAADADPGHPLIGMQWTSGKSAVSRANLAGDTRAIRIVGEVHDNDGHHRLRAAGLGRDTGAVVFEQLRTDQQPAIDAFLGLPKESRTIDAFLKAIDWEKNGWAKYDYKPLFKAVLDAELPIYAGDPPKDLIRKAAKEGAAAIPSAEQKRLGLDIPLDPSLHDASLSEIEVSHCGMMPKTAFGGMAFAQRLRDATLADVALRALEKHRAVTLFGGNGHVRTDRGVPWYIRRRDPSVPVQAAMLLEVEDGKTDPEAYLPRGPDGAPATDIVIFTPRAVRGDPCAAFRKATPSAPEAAGAVTKK